MRFFKNIRNFFVIFGQIIAGHVILLINPYFDTRATKLDIKVGKIEYKTEKDYQFLSEKLEIKE